jgi:HK97 family phage portal protein
MGIFSNRKNLRSELQTLKKQVDQLNAIKSFSIYDNGYFAGESQYNASVLTALKLYEQCSPLFMVVDKIVSAYINVPFRIKDKNTDEFIENHPVLELLEKPNSDESEFSFKESLATSFLITGNAFLIASGNINREPLELYNSSARFFNPIIEGRTNFNFTPSRYLYTAFNDSIVFKARDVIDGIRFYNDDIMELYHIKRYNAQYGNNNSFGMSKVYPLLREIEQYVSANVNNISLLQRGARMSTIFQNNRGEELTEAQYERAKAEAERFSGSENAGKTFIADGFEAKEVGQTNRDMQFKEMQDAMISRIANVYGVPLALLLDSTMTLNNLQTARLHLDKDAVIPLANRINKELTRFLMPRYKNSENLEFAIDITQIESLKPETLANAQIMAQTGVNTINEIRTELGFVHIDDGDKLTSQQNSVDVSSLLEDQDQSDNEPNDAEKSAYSKFYATMKSDNLKDEEIQALWLLARNK